MGVHIRQITRAHVAQGQRAYISGKVLMPVLQPLHTYLLTALVPLLRVYPSLLHTASASSAPKLPSHTPPHTPKKYSCSLPSDRYGPSISLTPPLNWKAGVPAKRNTTNDYIRVE